MSTLTWKQRLADRIAPEMAKEINDFEAQIALRKQGKIDEKVFAEIRLRRGAYGQRYDNGHRHDGQKTQELPYPSLTKGPDTFFDAPGMQRIKIPFGGMTPEQMRVLAETAEEYSDAICHITTRQDFQLHFVHIDDTPEMFRRLAAAGITTREACGNSVRNVTACPYAGVCRGEVFDVTPYSKAVAYYLLGHPDTQDFGRKFKIAFSGCKDEPCALVSIHDLGGIAKTRIVDGKVQRGFELYVGGGLGAVPFQAKLFDDFLPEEELLPISRAIGRVFARLGEKKNRNKARIKFLVQKLGIEEFKRLVLEERRTMPEDPSWRKYFDEIPRYEEKPGEETVPLTINGGGNGDPEFARWQETNLRPQRQEGYTVVTVTCPLGDLSSDQMRALADLTEKYASGHARTTIEQNIVLRWVPQAKVRELYTQLKAIGLGESGAGTIVDITACPGTDTCKLGIASSRGLAGEMRNRLAVKSAQLDEAIRDLRIKISGCFNSCGQHHVADIGFYGNSRNIGGYTVPHFQVVLGGQWTENGAAYGQAMGSIPSKRIPEVVERITGRFVAERQGDETFQQYCQRIGRKALKEMLTDLAKVPPHTEDASFYTDWGDPREFTIGDLGVGECAGEIVSLDEFGFSQAEAEVFEAQLLIEQGKWREADEMAYHAMLEAAKTLVKMQWLDVPDDPNIIVEEFRARFVEPKLFWDQYAGAKFAQYLFARHEETGRRFDRDNAHQLVDEASLFIDAAHACRVKVQQQMAALPASA